MGEGGPPVADVARGFECGGKSQGGKQFANNQIVNKEERDAGQYEGPNSSRVARRGKTWIKPLLAGWNGD